MRRRFVSILALLSLFSVLTVQASAFGEALRSPPAMPMGPPTVGDWPHEIGLTPRKMTFGAIEGGAVPPVQTFWVHNAGRGTLHWSATASDPWLQVDPMHGGDGAQVA